MLSPVVRLADSAEPAGRASSLAAISTLAARHVPLRFEPGGVRGPAPSLCACLGAQNIRNRQVHFQSQD